MAPGQVTDQRGRVLAVAKRQGRQLQRRHPPLRRLREVGDILLIEFQPAQVDEEGLRLCNIET
ncbi:hypothetical protein FXW78_45330 [Rhodococcus opacus]|nr:hypothetical protein [Rhodococcus opacus]